MRRGLAIALVLFACNDAPAPVVGDSSSGDATTGGTTTTAASVDGSTTGAPPVPVLEVSLELELRDTIQIGFGTTDGGVVAEIDPSRGFGLVGGALAGVGRIDAYPEAEATMYTATFEGPPVPDGPCGEAPISLALALHHDHDADVIAGGLTGYCGAATFWGVPAIEPLRISGRMP